MVTHTSPKRAEAIQQHKLSHISVAAIKPKRATMALPVGVGLLPSPKPDILWVLSTTFETKKVCLGPIQLVALKALAIQWDIQREIEMVVEDQQDLFYRVQSLLQASWVLFRLVHLLYPSLAVCCTPTSSKMLLAKIIVIGQKTTLEAAHEQIQNSGMKLPSLPPPQARKPLALAMPLKQAAYIGCKSDILEYPGQPEPDQALAW